MTATIPLYVVFLVLAVGVAAWALLLLYRKIESAGRTFAAAAASNAATLKTLQELSAALACLPQLLESVTKIGTAQLEIMEAQRLPAAAQNSGPIRHNSNLTQRGVEGANLEHEVQQLQRAEGIGREEALMRMNGANADSVWAGNKFFEGWEGR